MLIFALKVADFSGILNLRSVATLSLFTKTGGI